MQKESELLKQCKAYLDVQRRLGRLTYKRINVSPIIRNSGRTKIFTPNWDMVGMPDIQIYFDWGFMGHVELKTKTGKVSKYQDLFRKEIEALGHLYEVVRSIDELKRFCEEVYCAISESKRCIKLE